MIATRSSWLLMLSAVWVGSASAADSFAVGVLSCAAETDRDRRLDCYDRAVANYTARLTDGNRSPAASASPAPEKRGATAVVAPPVPGAAVSAAPGAAASTPQGTAVAAAPGAASTPAAAQTPVGATAKATAAPARHVSAHIASIDYFPDYVVLHLDNQQVWKQVSDSSGSLVLHNGDPVTIDKQMGSYWLSGPKGEAVQVKLEASKP